MSDSILDTIKKMLGIPSEDTAFNTDILANINTVFMFLNQIGIGPTDPYSIDDNAKTWADFLSTELTIYPAVKTLMYLRVKLMFDPPSSSFVLSSINDQVLELEYRLRTQAETRPVPPVV